ncbi:TPR Domain containing protein [Histomonas meleagridis]|uniref:TPR Domain containing protein n=1 Tax=Histomonas meleagridis TaxID=135588 RepID=UPI0035595C2E|nr:TPR Domain containing protein [Histomonas meleagridis]KAH0796158.1 TPR Domain containing protein [Histomonas meleagridis]
MIVGAKKKTRSSETKKEAQPESDNDTIQKFIENRDYQGASTFITFLRDDLKQPYTKEMGLWHGYSLFHQGHYSEAIEIYEKLLKDNPEDTSLNLNIASCHFYNRDFDEAREMALKGTNGDFKTRLIFHIAHQTNNEEELFQAHSELMGTLENQLSLAAIHYMRSNYQDAIEIYQRLLLQHPDFLALNVYISMCQFKLDQYEESNESVDLYLADYSDSAVALNLKSCDYLKIFDSEIAQSQLLQIKKFSSASYDFVDLLVTHNMCIFQDGENGFEILPKLVPSLTEARFNLAILYMRENNAVEAYNLLKDYTPIEFNETVLKASTLLAIGQLNSDTGPIEEANEIFSEVGNMDLIKDTVPGREALASSKFINNEYDETLRVLATIEEYVGDCDEFNYNKGMTLAALSRWAEAERYLLLVKSPKYTKEIFYISWLCRCYIKNGKAELAWNLYKDSTSTEESKTLLNIIASDCYIAGQFYFAMKAYDVLSKFDTDPELKQGMIASAAGVFRSVLTRKETMDKLPEILTVLASEPDAADVARVVHQYAIQSGEFDDY